MVPISVSIEGWFGLGWTQWKQFVTEVPKLGFAGLFLSDHLQLSTLDATPRPSLELMVALTYLASQSERIHFGAMVSPLSLRDPVLLARQSMALDDLSGGRLVVGVGVGWNEPEHAMFGYQLGDMNTRMARFAEGLEVITRLTRSSKPVSFDGRFFQLRDALLLPRSPRIGGPPIMIGGTGPRRTLPLVARYADRWDGGFLTLDAFRERSLQLNQLLHALGRKPTDVLRSMTVPILCGRNKAELEQRTQGIRRMPGFSDLPLETLIEQLRANWASIIGTPEEVAEQLRTYAAAGVDEIIMQWTGVDDIEGLQLFASEVLPLIQGSMMPNELPMMTRKPMHAIA